ncbi:MAG: hypothetical protein PHF33_00960 [Candidatus Delongbacteria bacterium]|nr:hypothetical protein [Candidatus Delongbacteria bacterium]MDD4204477.1 hypothetical protein [Candidatus Delongbacteria bacterium]
MQNKIKMIVLAALIIFPIILSAQYKGEGMKHIRYAVDKDGNKMVMRTMIGKPPSDPSLSPFKPNYPKVDKADSKEINYLTNVPCYDWSYGCTATATSMFAGYYDNYGADNIYIGPENGGLQPMSNAVWNTQASQSGTSQVPVAATKMGVDGRSAYGHGDDYWVQPDSEGDPYFGSWTEHNYNDGQRCTGDFMGTNQFNNWENIDGSTSLWSYLAPSGSKLYDKADELNPPSRDGIHGMRLFFESIGYDVDLNYTQLIDGFDDPTTTEDDTVIGGYTFQDYMNAIDSGRPVILGLDNHSVLGYGYDNTGGAEIMYVRSTWYNSASYAVPGAETMTFGGDELQGLYHYAMSEVILSPKSYYSAPDDVFALNFNRSVTVTWSDPSEGTKNLTYNVYRDDVFLANTATAGYVDNTAADGVHSYMVKAVYTDPDPDLESYPSNYSFVYVSISVTEFHDDFESGSGQWLLYNGWGLDTQYKYAGAYSLSDSPGVNYADDLEFLPEGGSIGEIAPGMNFTSALDATCDFYLRYVIEESFDYLHFQSCKDGVNWVTLQTWSSETLGLTWAQKSFSLGVFAGESNVRFRFLMQSDQGYNAAGTNVDNINIVPNNTSDLTPPFVMWSVPRDYYDNNNQDGYTIVTDIIDVSGVNYAHVIYSVDGGANQVLNPTSVNGIEYTFVIPPQAVGAYVEYDFECQDNAPTHNTGTYGTYRYIPGPYYYQAGWHRVFDNGFVTYIGTLTNPPADTQYDYLEAVSVKFTSFHDDVEGLVVRGYTDQGQPANANMLIQIYDDNNGIPGNPLLPSPVSFANPATLGETQKWAYVDLSSYTQLQDLTGTFHAAVSSATGTTIINYTQASESQMYPYGATCWKGYIMGGETQSTWYPMPDVNQHTRIVTTDYGYTPGIIETSAAIINETVPVDGTDSGSFQISNVGDYALDYNGSIEYTSWPGSGSIDVHSNNFNAGISPYTVAGSWVTGAGSTWNDGTQCAQVTVQTSSSVLTSNVFDGTDAVDLYLDFDQTFLYKTGSSSKVDYSIDGGTSWTTIYNNAATTTAVHQHIAIPNVSNNMKLRFTAVITKSGPSTGYWKVDNIVVSGTEVIGDWLTIDGGITTSGSLNPSESAALNYGLDATGLAEGDYSATIKLTSDYSNKNVYVNMTVGGTGPVIPAVPANIVTSIVGGDVYINWDDSAAATAYAVYSSADPYGTFTLFEDNIAVSEFTYTPSVSKMFFYVIAKNSTKESPKTLVVKKAK